MFFSPPFSFFPKKLTILMLTSSPLAMVYHSLLHQDSRILTPIANTLKYFVIEPAHFNLFDLDYWEWE